MFGVQNYHIFCVLPRAACCVVFYLLACLIHWLTWLTLWVQKHQRHPSVPRQVWWVYPNSIRCWGATLKEEGRITFHSSVLWCWVGLEQVMSSCRCHKAQTPFSFFQFQAYVTGFWLCFLPLFPFCATSPKQCCKNWKKNGCLWNNVFTAANGSSCKSLSSQCMSSSSSLSMQSFHFYIKERSEDASSFSCNANRSNTILMLLSVISTHVIVHMYMGFSFINIAFSMLFVLSSKCKQVFSH